MMARWSAVQMAQAIGVLPRDPVMRRALHVSPDEAFFSPVPLGVVAAQEAAQDFGAFNKLVADGAAVAGPIVILPIDGQCHSTKKQDGAERANDWNFATLQIVVEYLAIYTQLPVLNESKIPRGCAPAQLALHRQRPVPTDQRKGNTGLAGPTDHLMDHGYSARSLLEVLGRNWPAKASVQLGVVGTPLLKDSRERIPIGQLVKSIDVGAVGERPWAAGLVQLCAGAPSRSDASKIAIEELRSALQTAVSAVLGLFGFAPCVFFSCALNPQRDTTPEKNGFVTGSSETCTTPLHLCPLCLRKLWALHDGAGRGPLDVVGRYKQLAQFYFAHGLRAESQWAVERVIVISQQVWDVMAPRDQHFQPQTSTTTAHLGESDAQRVLQKERARHLKLKMLRSKESRRR